MHLAFNASDLGRQRGGNEAYLLGLLGGLAPLVEETGIDVSLIVGDEGQHLARSEHRFHCFKVIHVGQYRRVPFLLWQQTAVLRRLRPDWYISTFFLPPNTPCRSAVLVHDLSFRARPDYYPSTIALYMRVLTGLAVRQADRIIALSEFTQQEIRRFYPSAGDKTAVVYPGVGPEFTLGGDPAADDQVLADLGIRRPYLLAIGNVHPRKNLERLLTAWQQMQETSHQPPPMVWAGISRWGSEPLLEKARAAGVLLPGFVAAEQLPALYRQAKALVYPSLYEGFGLPPLEAMACGTPVLTSHTTALPEAVADAAVTVDPRSVQDLGAGLAQVVFDETMRSELRARGLARAAQFRWERTAQKLVDVLTEECRDRSQ
jgi:glycosyltransferase involved in cell wall biosynthesis